MKIYCCACAKDVEARLTTGAEVYPWRPDLADVPRWRCDVCRNHVGTHHKTKDPTKPLGVIPTPAIRAARMHIHDTIDPLWKSGRIKRSKLYAMLSEQIGGPYHTADIRTLDEARAIYRAARKIARELQGETV